MAQDNEPLNSARAFSVVDKADWNARLVRSEKGGLLPVIENVVSILLNDERWNGVIAFDEFSSQTMKLKPPPFDRGEIGEWTDMDDSRLELWLAETYGMRSLRSETLMKGVLLAADAHRYHQVRDYLESVTWDGVPRVAAFLWAYLGVNKSDYAEKVATKWLVGAVARIFRPGVKMDNVLILEGSQGTMKSSALKAMFDPWFTDAGFEIGSTDGLMIMRGMWCVELAELDGFNRADANKSKAFFTRTTDRYRSPYGRRPINVARQGVFAGSVNHGTYLKDDTGNRRYWPVSVGLIGLEAIRADRDQIWAEAVRMYRDGVEWHVRAAERELYEGEQDARYIGDSWETRLRNWLDSVDAGGMRPDKVSLHEVMVKGLGLDTAKHTLAEQQRVGRLMARVGWKRKRSGDKDGREWVYVRPEPEAES